MKKGILAFIFALIALIMIGVSLGINWYVISFFTLDMGFGLFDDMEFFLGIKPTVTIILVILAMVFSLLLMIFAILSVKSPGKAKIGAIFGILAMIFVLVAPLYFMMDFTSDSEIGFWESEKDPTTGVEASAGPGAGWYICFVAFVFNLIAFIMVIKAGKEYPEGPPPMAPPPPGMAPPPYYGAPPPPPPPPQY